MSELRKIISFISVEYILLFIFVQISMTLLFLSNHKFGISYKQIHTSEKQVKDKTIRNAKWRTNEEALKRYE